MLWIMGMRIVDTSSWSQHTGVEDSTMRFGWCPLCCVDSYLWCLPTRIFFMDAIAFRQFLRLRPLRLSSRQRQDIAIIAYIPL